MLARAGVTGVSQARLALDANVIGLGYAHGDDVLYEEGVVRDLAGRPRLCMDDLREFLPSPVAIVVRQRPRVAVGEQGVSLDASRDWLGVDALALDAEQRAASARWWSISAATEAALRASWTDERPVPLIVSVGGYIARGYDIAAFDDETERIYDLDRRAFRFADGEPQWARRLVGCWLASGPGRPLVVWKR